MKTNLMVRAAVGMLAAFLLAGCSTEILRTGKYEASNGNGDFAVVYDDLIFLRVKSPEPAPGSLAYWEWAGKYKLRSDGTVELDMDTPTRKRWNFYYVFFKKRSGIGVSDLTENRGFDLIYQIPRIRPDRKQVAPMPAGSGGVNPIYSPAVEEPVVPKFE